MRKLTLSLFAATAVLCTPVVLLKTIQLAKAQEVVIVKEQPPVAKVEVVPNRPSNDVFWVAGYWQWEGRWVWVPGHWERPPHPTAVWVPGHWGWRPYGWVWVPGRWVY